MPTRYTTISIPEARGRQLREIAREHRKSVSDLLVGWIQRELTDLGWQDASAAVRGELGHDGEELVIRADLFGGAYQVTWTIDQARSFASTIESMATIGGPTRKSNTQAATLDLDAIGPQGLTIVQRKGSGIILQINSFKRSVSLDVGLEFASTLMGFVRSAEEQASQPKQAAPAQKRSSKSIKRPARSDRSKPGESS